MGIVPVRHNHGEGGKLPPPPEKIPYTPMLARNLHIRRELSKDWLSDTDATMGMVPVGPNQKGGG